MDTATLAGRGGDNQPAPLMARATWRPRPIRVSSPGLALHGAWSTKASNPSHSLSFGKVVLEDRAPILPTSLGRLEPDPSSATLQPGAPRPPASVSSTTKWGSNDPGPMKLLIRRLVLHGVKS